MKKPKAEEAEKKAEKPAKADAPAPAPAKSGRKDKVPQNALIAVDQTLPFNLRRQTSRKAACDAVLKKFGSGTVGKAKDLAHKVHPRITSGIFSLDYALGGGWARGRINLSWGDKSSSKTTTVLRAIANAQKTDLKTNRFIPDMTPEEQAVAIPLNCAFIDVEGTFDQEWATAVGVDVDALTLVRPSSSEEAGDIMQTFLNNGFDVVVLDSIAAMIPEDELTGAMEDYNVGTHARLVNKMLKKIQGVLNATGKEDPMLAPTVFLINQQRNKVGVMFGNPIVKPGGVGQDFYPTIEVRFSPGKAGFYDGKDKTLVRDIEFNFEVIKNKVSPPKIHGSYLMQLVDDDDLMLKAGEVSDLKQVMEFAEKLGIFAKAEKPKPGYLMYGEPYKTKNEIMAKFYLDKDRYTLLKADIFKRIFNRT